MSDVQSIIIIVSIIAGIPLLIVHFVRRERKRQEQIRRDIELLETATSQYRGNGAERALVLTLLKKGIPANTIFHDLYVDKGGGYYSQIDLVVAHNVGIIVFEVKDYGGWIFGNGKQKNWTQVLAYGDAKHRFYNPVMQNDGHIAALKKQLPQFHDVPFYSVIVFYGKSRFKDISNIPTSTLLIYPSDVIDVVDSIITTNPPAKFTNKYEVVDVLKKAVKNGEDEEIQRQHSENIRNNMSYRNTQASSSCSKQHYFSRGFGFSERAIKKEIFISLFR